MMELIELAKFTGNYEDECPEVELADKRIIYPAPVYQNGIMMSPSKEYLDKYKGEVYAVILRYNSQYYCLGYTPLDKNYSDKGDFPQEGHIRTKNFIVRFNDKDDECHVTQREGAKQEIVIKGDKTFIKSDKINLTEENADNPCLLGKETVDLLKDILDFTNNINTVVLALDSSVLGAANATLLGKITVDIQQYKTTIEQLKSQKVNLK